MVFRVKNHRMCANKNGIPAMEFQEKSGQKVYILKPHVLGCSIS
jgi:hypothetical protein